MATKRRIRVEMAPVEPEQEADDRHQPVRSRPDRGWRHWLLTDYLRYWFLVGCLLVDAFIVLELMVYLDGWLSILLPLIVLSLLVVTDFLLYRRLWSEDGRWGRG